MSSRSSKWMTVEAAAGFLGMTVVTLRRAIARNAQATPDGRTVSRVDGITARKFNRLWLVCLDAEWTNPFEEQKRP